MLDDYTKRERLSYLSDYFCWRLGLFRKYECFKYNEVRRVVFVCTGNICRSAYADAKLRQLGFQAASLGVHAKNGSPADPVAIKVARGRGIDLNYHRAQNIETFQSVGGDLFVCMEEWHAKKLRSKYQLQEIALLGPLVDLPKIYDPYGKTERIFQSTFDLIDEALLRMNKELSGNPAEKYG